MGISGLLPLLKSIQKPCHLKKFAGQTIGIDAFGWLHRGSVACAIELALDKPTRKYVDFAVGRVRMLLDFGIKPYLVFDGDSLPSKAETNAQRRLRREESKAAGLALYHADKKAQAYQELQKAASVTPIMMKELIEAIKSMDVMYLVAPYEADAQLVYLERQGIIDGILSEDSDMLVYGAKRLLTKLDQYAECVQIERADFAKCTEISLAGWTDTMFRRMAILSGCDYLPSIGKIGLKTAYRHVRKHNDIEKILKIIQFEGKLSVPVDYLERFRHAELTFVHHRVFCPTREEMVFMEELPKGVKESDMPYLGKFVPADTAVGVACGDLDPKTKEPFHLKRTPRFPPGARRVTAPAPSTGKPDKLITSFLSKRQPLVELDPNTLTPSPSQQQLIREYHGASWEPRLVSSAPQPRTYITSITPDTQSTQRQLFLERASTKSTFQPPKRPRLCSELQESSSLDPPKRSPFFAVPEAQASPSVQKKARNKKQKQRMFDVWSDDSVDDVLLGLPDVQQKASPQKETLEAREQNIEPGVADTYNTIPQSSPPADLTDEPAEVVGHSVTGSNVDPELPAVGRAASEPFEDILDSHIHTQRMLKTFVYQSTSQQEAALRTLSPQNRKNAVHHSTFLGQTPEVQKLALQSLPPSCAVDEFCLQLKGSCGPRPVDNRTTIVVSSPPRPLKATTPPRCTPMRERQRFTAQYSDASFGVRGSEDALIPNSEDDEDDEVSQTVRQPDLHLFAYAPA